MKLMKNEVQQQLYDEKINDRNVLSSTHNRAALGCTELVDVGINHACLVIANLHCRIFNKNGITRTNSVYIRCWISHWSLSLPLGK
jgi:hypothetical protein